MRLLILEVLALQLRLHFHVHLLLANIIHNNRSHTNNHPQLGATHLDGPPLPTMGLPKHVHVLF